MARTTKLLLSDRKRLRIVITAGPTREHFDSVRFISNASSGKLGYAVAEAAQRAGHLVTLVSGPTALPPPCGVRCVSVISADEMLQATRAAFRRSDVGVFVAAVSDFRPVRRSARKGAKPVGRWRVELEPTKDIAAEMGKIKGRRVCIGFALEDHAGRQHAADKMRRKNFDAVILNQPSNIGSVQARAHVRDASGRWTVWPLQSKRAMAQRIVRLAEMFFTVRGRK